MKKLKRQIGYLLSLAMLLGICALPVSAASNAFDNYPTSIPGSEEYVRFSSPYVGTDKDTATVYDESGDFTKKEVTIYEFPVGTEIGLTTKGIQAGYSISRVASEDESESSQNKLTFTKPTTWREMYTVYSNSKSESFTFYIRPVNVSKSFDDVQSNAYYSDGVQWAVKYGITSGTSATTFSPNQTCTVAQIITFLWRAKGYPTPIGDGFSNVSKNDYYYEAATWAKGYGLIDGDQFTPNAPCTRSMVVTYLWKMNGMLSVAPNSNFTDVPANADYAQAVAWAVEKGITSGTSATTFSPDTTCTRGQIVTFLYRAENQGQQQTQKPGGLGEGADLDALMQQQIEANGKTEQEVAKQQKESGEWADGHDDREFMTPEQIRRAYDQMAQNR